MGRRLTVQAVHIIEVLWRIIVDSAMGSAENEGLVTNKRQRVTISAASTYKGQEIQSFVLHRQGGACNCSGIEKKKKRKEKEKKRKERERKKRKEERRKEKEEIILPLGWRSSLNLQFCPFKHNRHSQSQCNLFTSKVYKSLDDSSWTIARKFFSLKKMKKIPKFHRN